MKDVNQPLEPFPKTPEKIQAASEATGQGLPNLTLPPDPSPGVWEGGRMGGDQFSTDSRAFFTTLELPPTPMLMNSLVPSLLSRTVPPRLEKDPSASSPRFKSQPCPVILEKFFLFKPRISSSVKWE